MGGGRGKGCEDVLGGKLLLVVVRIRRSNLLRLKVFYVSLEASFVAPAYGG